MAPYLRMFISGICHNLYFVDEFLRKIARHRIYKVLNIKMV